MAETFTGYYEGKKISFNREWGGHRFTDSECITLCELKEIEFDFITKSGHLSHVKGSLAVQTYKGHKFFGFKPNFLNKPEHVSKKDDELTEWCRHKFTEQEKKILLSGNSIFITDAWSRKNNSTFSCNLSYKLDPDTNTKKLVPDFKNVNSNKIKTSTNPLDQVKTRTYFDDLIDPLDDNEIEEKAIHYDNSACILSVQVLQEDSDESIDNSVKYALVLYSDGTKVKMYYEDYDIDTLFNMSLEEVIKNYALEVE